MLFNINNHLPLQNGMPLKYSGSNCAIFCVTYTNICVCIVHPTFAKWIIPKCNWISTAWLCTVFLAQSEWGFGISRNLIVSLNEKCIARAFPSRLLYYVWVLRIPFCAACLKWFWLPEPFTLLADAVLLVCSEEL